MVDGWWMSGGGFDVIKVVKSWSFKVYVSSSGLCGRDTRFLWRASQVLAFDVEMSHHGISIKD
jgi:hypothetical protein